MTGPGVDDYLARINRVPGWFLRTDQLLFPHLNALQRAAGVGGDLLEIGVYRGKSAILLGYFAGPGERLVVCDVFDTAGRRQFERRYRRFHERPPLILHFPSRDILERAGLARTFRFMHVDGDHGWEAVREDLRTVRALLVEGGLVVFDDHLSALYPGTAAAVWSEVTAGRLIPLCMTPSKLYACLPPGPPDWAAGLAAWARAQPDLEVAPDSVADRQFLRIRRAQRPSGLRKVYWWARRLARRAPWP